LKSENNALFPKMMAAGMIYAVLVSAKISIETRKASKFAADFVSWTGLNRAS
jgi:hypothetical protein